MDDTASPPAAARLDQLEQEIAHLHRKVQALEESVAQLQQEMRQLFEEDYPDGH